MVIVLSILFTLAYSAPVRTSLCCCGCLEEPCPVVGSSCPPPHLPCGVETTPETVYCSELQRLWEMAVVEKKNESGPIPPEERDAPGFTPFVSDTGRPYRIRNFEKPPPELLETDLVNQDVIFRGLNSTTEIRYSPPKKVILTTEKMKIDSLEKMQNILSELQEMITTVKDLMATEGIISPKQNTTVSPAKEGVEETTTKTSEEHEKMTLPPDADNITEEEERQAIDDVIRRMKGAFRKVTKDGTPPVSEVDSSVSTKVIDVQSIPLRTSPIRPKRAAKKNAGNCNDEQLRGIIDDNIGKDAKTSKRQIQKAAEKEFGGTFNVICSPCEFSFLISSQKYCEGFKDQVACFVFLQPPTSVKKFL